MARKIERLIYTNENGESVEFSRVSKYHANMYDVSGLADIRNAIYSVNSMGQDGDTYLGNRIESREIEISGSINERNKEIAFDFRRRLNHVLNPHLAATLTYEYGDFKRVIDCKVDNAPVYSRKAIFQDFTIQLVCLDPFWRMENEMREEIATWIGAFEFPEEIPEPEGWEIGYRLPSLIVNVHNGGDVKAGIKVVFKAIGEVKDPTILNVDTQQFIKFNMTLKAGDVLSVSTGYGKKRAILTRNGIETDAFRYIDMDSTYLQLEIGDNLFRYSAAENEENLEVIIYHNDYYLGV